jgi:hypothetical protein
MSEVMPIREGESVLVAADGVQAEVDLVGAGLRRMTVGGIDYLANSTTSGARLVGASDTGGSAAALVADDAHWRVMDHIDGTLTLTADTEGVSYITAVSVGSFGLAVIHGITNTGDHPVGVGIISRVHPTAGADSVLALCGQAPADLGDLVGADSASLPGRAVPGLELDLLVGGGRPLPGNTHVVHRLRAGAHRDGDGVRIWGDAEFAWTRAAVTSDSVRVDLRTLPPDGGPSDLFEVGPGQSRMLSWGVQPFELHGPKS